MADDTREIKPEAVDAALGGMKLEEGGFSTEALDTMAVNGTHGDAPTPSNDIKRSQSSTPIPRKFASQSPIKKESASQTPNSEEDMEQEVIGGGITVTVEPGKAPKLSRKSSQKVIARPAPLFDDMPDATEEAISVFQVIKDCIYGSKYMGYSEHDALDCDCSEEFREFSDCLFY